MSIKTNVEDFCWLLDIADFMKVTSGVVLNVDNLVMKTEFSISNKFFIRATVDVEDGEVFSMTFTNGSTKLGICSLIQSMKAISGKKGNDVRITEKDKTILFESQQKFEIVKCGSSVAVVECKDFKSSIMDDFDSEEEFSGKISLESLDNMKKMIKGVEGGGSNPVCILKYNGEEGIFVIGDSNRTKQMSFGIDECFGEPGYEFPIPFPWTAVIHVFAKFSTPILITITKTKVVFFCSEKPDKKSDRTKTAKLVILR